MSDQPMSLYHLWLTNPEGFKAASFAMQQKMVEWWQHEVVQPINIMPNPLTEDEKFMAELLFSSAVGLPSATVCMAAGCGLPMSEETTVPMLIQLAIEFGILIGKGYLNPAMPPATVADFVDMMRVHEQERQLAGKRVGDKIKAGGLIVKP